MNYSKYLIIFYVSDSTEVATRKRGKKTVTQEIRSSKRKEPNTPRRKLHVLKKRLHFVTLSKNQMKVNYKERIAGLRSKINYAKLYQVKYLNQDITRKKNTIAKKQAEIASLKAKLHSTDEYKELNELKKVIKNERRQHKRDLEAANQAHNVTVLEFEDKVVKLQEKVKLQEDEITSLQDENLTMQDKVLEAVDGNAEMQKQGKSYSVDLRMFVYDSLVNNVPTKNIPTLIRKFSQRSDMQLQQVPHRNTVEMMARELGVLSDIIAAEALMEKEDLTIAFDATTQEGMHVNSIHVTSKDECFVLAVDQLPGGKAEDYQLHLCDATDAMADTYCKVYSTDFAETRQHIISNISNTMTDRAAVNHATIQQLELVWDKKLNELNCHLHPLDTIASSMRTALKSCEPSDLVKKLYGAECMSHQLILGMNKFRYKDGKGDPRGFISALDSAGLPKGLLPRYRGNRLHIMFNISGKLCHHEEFFQKFLSEGTVSCRGLQSALLHDFSSSVTKVELHVLGLLGKLLTGPWMKKFYTSSQSEVNHIDGIHMVKEVTSVVREFANNTAGTLTTTQDFFGNLLENDATLVTLQSQPVDDNLFHAMMKACLLKVDEVLQRQYARYFTLDVTEILRKETESSRCHNIDAKTIMGMFSAAKDHAPNATMGFISSRIKAVKNNVVDRLDELEKGKREKSLFS